MTQANRVYSTPPTNTSVTVATESAPGASALCQPHVIRDSRLSASQTLAIGGEPHATHPTCSSGAGGSMTRRFLMNSIVALPIAAAVPVARPSIAAAGATQADDPIFAAIEAHRRAFRRRTRYSLSTATLRKRCQKASHKAAFPSGKRRSSKPMRLNGSRAKGRSAPSMMPKPKPRFS